MTTLTLVVPVHNLGAYLPETLATLEQQTAPFELWLIDDASTDDSADQLRQFAASRAETHVAVFPNHRGVSAARNYGIQHATGDVVAFADGDDQLHPDYVKTLIDGFRPGVVAVTVGCRWWHAPISKENHYERLTQREMFTQVSHRGTEVGGYVWNKAYSLDAIRQADLEFDESLSIAEDYLFTAQFVARTRGTYLYNPVLRYTKVNRPDSTIHTRRMQERQIEGRVFDEIYRLGKTI